MATKAKSSPQRKGKKSSPKKGKGRSKGNVMGYQIHQAPVSAFSTPTALSLFKFGEASPNDRFPEGGLRISGRFVNTTDDTITQNATASTLGGFAVAYQYIACALCCVLATASYAGSSALNLVGANSVSAAPLQSISSWFKFFRIRKLIFHYEAGCSTATAGTLQLAYDPDAQAVGSRIVVASVQSLAATTRSLRTPVWQSADLECICQKTASPADELFENVGASVVNTDATADLLKWIQGCIIATNDTKPGAQITLGRWSVTMVVDLYGFSQFQIPTSVSLQHEAALKNLWTRFMAESKSDEVKHDASKSTLPGLSAIQSCPMTSSARAKEDGGDTDPDSPVLIKSLRGQTVYTDFGSKDKQQAPPSLTEKGPMSARGRA